MAIAEILLPVLGGVKDLTNPPGLLFTASGRAYLTFDGTTDELLVWSFRLPANYSSGLTVKAQYSMASATTNNVALRTQLMAAAAAVDIITDSYATLDKSTDSTVPGTAGLMKEISHALTNVDSVAADSYMALQLGRENATTGTNASGDMYVWAVSLIYTTA
jgi:hypothetical protein